MAMADWIWLNDKDYGAYQTTGCTTFADAASRVFAVAEFEKTVVLRERPARVSLRVSGDTKFWLWADGQFMGMGPVCAGGDFGNRLAMPYYYASRYELTDAGREIRLFARVQLSPVVMTDYSCGHGGFYLEGEAVFADGTTERFGSDGTWKARYNGQFRKDEPFGADFTKAPDRWMDAQPVKSVWTLKDSPLPLLREERIAPVRGGDLTAQPGETVEETVLFDKIYSGYVTFDIEASARCTVTAVPFELEDQPVAPEAVVSDHDETYRSLKMQSAGGYRLTLTNEGDKPAAVKNPALIFTCYPVGQSGWFKCSDEGLNKVYDVCRWTLQICRQSLHLDSPRHQETLGCTGDYYVESLMNYFTFGDPRLTRLDIVRTADWLTMADGFMFHTTYSMIWVEMLKDCFMFTNDMSLLKETEPALTVLLARFADYVGESGLVETPPSWMFVDWNVTEDFSMHHPPKALGQTVLNALYYQALNTAAGLYARLGLTEKSGDCKARAAALKAAFNVLLYDEAEGLYLDGLNTPQEKCGRPLPPDMMDVSGFMPENTDKRFHTTQANAMTVLCGLCEGERAEAIMTRVMEDGSLVPFQPYYAHFVLNALWKTGLFEKYGMKLLSRWKPMVESCDKGLQEGWIAPGGNYSFDHSHAWGGTPAYQLPCRLLGFEMLEPGFKKVTLRPSLMGLAWADIAVPTPCGLIHCVMKDGKIEIDAPKEIEIVR